MTVGDTQLTARLHDNATARDLAAQLPLTLTFRDHNSVEKTAPLPRELSLDGAPEGHGEVPLRDAIEGVEQRHESAEEVVAQALVTLVHPATRPRAPGVTSTTMALML